jgi:sugar lactone lactonase YvrE
MMKRKILLALFTTACIAACKKENSSGSKPHPPAVITVTTLAGSGAIGKTDGTGTAATFYKPIGLAVDAAGNVYVADFYNSLIRKISPAGVVNTLAGTGAVGHTDGPAASATFNYPTGVAVDAAGNVYVADAFNNLIRKITPAGSVSTIAGNGLKGSANGTGAAASFYYLEGIALDDAGNLYIADTFNNMIRKISTSGAVTTLAGNGGGYGFDDGAGASASFAEPQGITVDAGGNIYVADSFFSTIRKISADGMVSTLAGRVTLGYGSNDDKNGTGAAASFYYPEGIAVDAAGNLYVADSSNHQIRKVSPAGVVTTLAGNGSAGSGNGTAMAASFNYPGGVAVDAKGNVYVGDTNNNLIRKIVTP